MLSSCYSYLFFYFCMLCSLWYFHLYTTHIAIDILVLRHFYVVLLFYNLCGFYYFVITFNLLLFALIVNCHPHSYRYCVIAIYLLFFLVVCHRHSDAHFLVSVSSSFICYSSHAAFIVTVSWSFLSCYYCFYLRYSQAVLIVIIRFLLSVCPCHLMLLLCYSDIFILMLLLLILVIILMLISPLE